MKTRVIAPAALQALKEALSTIYWFKAELRSFVSHTIGDPALLSRLDWSDRKRNIVACLIEHLARDQATYQEDLLRLLTEVAAIDDFSHLERLDGGREKAADARAAVAALRKFVSSHRGTIAEQHEAEQRRQAAYEARLRNQGVRERLEQLRGDVYGLIGSDAPQKRGFRLEKLIKDLFALFDLDPRASFRIAGEQIDGAFTYDGTDYLFEAKWQQELVGCDDLDAFSRKLSRKLDNTLGLFLSINGFSEDGVRQHSTGKKTMILMDGSDLMGVLEERIDLIELLYRKRRHAAQTGNIYLRLHEVL